MIETDNRYRMKLRKNKEDYLSGKISYLEFAKRTKTNRMSLKRTKF